MKKKMATGFIGLNICMLLMACGDKETPKTLEVSPIQLETQQVPPANESEGTQSEGNSSGEKPEMTQLNEHIPE